MPSPPGREAGPATSHIARLYRASDLRGPVVGTVPTGIDQPTESCKSIAEK
ncbi:hypothetical protein MHEI_27420 [Mycobacterium heidelbergense]|nr:hypothetical protein MHEI_27420 [Mycobacterium heidelbergense]